MMYIADDYIIWHFESKPVKCGKCGAILDWWVTARREVENNFMYNKAFAFVGARETWFTLILKTGERKVYRFSENGIPAGSKVLYVNYTPQGPGSFPAEIHGNVPTRRFFSDQVALYPVPLGGQESVDETEVSVFVSWVPSTSADDSWQSLVDAFEDYSHERYSSMVVPANVAVESALSRLLNSYLQRFVSKKKRVEDFLDMAATYSHQLNVLLPMIASLNGIPDLPDPIRGALNSLRGLRNDLAHDGVTGSPLNTSIAAELLCGALFGFHYVRYVANRLPPLSVTTNKA